MSMISEATAVRCEVVRRRYTPIPLHGKIPPMTEWQKIENVTPGWIAMWAKSWVDATNTGILSKDTPAIDIDIYSEPAAVACEELIRDRFEDQGFVLVRIGMPPKRLIPFRTETPFAKITVNFVSDRGEKIEMLGAGQQFVCHGIHPDTHKPYHWFGGEPWSIPHADLPYLHPEEAQQLVVDVVQLLVSKFNYHPASGSGLRSRDNAPKATAEHAWHILITNILTGCALHDSLRDLAGMLIASGMNSGAATHLLQALVEQVEPYDARVEARLRDLPRAIDGAVKKWGHPPRA